MKLTAGDFFVHGVSTNVYRVKEIRPGKTVKGRFRRYDIEVDPVISNDPRARLSDIPSDRFPSPISKREVIAWIFFPRSAEPFGNLFSVY